MINSYSYTTSQEPFDLTVGTGTTAKTEYPIYMFYDYGYFGFIYKNSELNLTSTVNITGIRFQMQETGGTEFMDNQTLKLAQVNQDQFDINIRNDFTQVPLQPTPWITNNTTIVKSNFTWTVSNSPPTWTEILFTTPFVYNPNDTTYPHLLIMWTQNDGTYNTGGNSPWSLCFTDNSKFRSYYDYSDNAIPSLTRYGTRDSTGIPNIQFICQI